MRTSSILRRFLTILILLGLFSGLAQPIVRAQEHTPQQEQHNTFLPAVSDFRSQGDGLLFRTFVTVRTTVQWRDLEGMNPLFLERGDAWSLLLVDDLQ